GWDGGRPGWMGEAGQEAAGGDAAQPQGGCTVGEGTSRVKEGNGTASAAPQRAPREIERDIEHLRTRLDRSLAELDRRRHELTNVKLQMRKHPGACIGAGPTVALLRGG